MSTFSGEDQNLAQYLDEVNDNRETVIIQRRGHEDVIMISADELNSLLETTHLLRSPKNAERLLVALERARSKSETAQSIETLKSELGLADEQT